MTGVGSKSPEPVARPPFCDFTKYVLHITIAELWENRDLVCSLFRSLMPKPTRLRECYGATILNKEKRAPLRRAVLVALVASLPLIRIRLALDFHRNLHKRVP